MKQKLMENREKLTDAAYRKAFTAAESIESLFSVSDKMLRVIAYIFEKLEEVTPLMLQKLLYFIQGVYSALYGRRRYMSCSGISNIIRSMMRGSRFWKGQRMP